MSNSFEDRNAADQILDRLADDAGFEGAITEDSAGALANTGIRMEDTEGEGDDVSGYSLTWPAPVPPGGGGGPPMCSQTVPDPGKGKGGPYPEPTGLQEGGGEPMTLPNPPSPSGEPTKKGGGGAANW